MLEKYRKLSKNGTELAEDELNELKSKSQDMKARMEHIDLKDIVEYSRKVRVKKDILVTDWFNVSLICLEEGQEIPPHPEPYAVLFHRSHDICSGQQYTGNSTAHAYEPARDTTATLNRSSMLQ